MIAYQFIVTEVEVARVKLPKTISTTQAGFIKSQLQKLHPEISVFKQSSEYLHGLTSIWKLEKIQ